MWKKPTDECVLWYDVFIYLFIFCCYWCFLTFFAFAYPWCMMDSERGCCRWSWHIWSFSQLIFPKCLVRSEVSLLSISSALHSWMASSSEKTENHFCFLLMVPASHPCHVLICCVAALSVKRLGMIIDLHKKCMTLFVLRCTRDFQTVWPVVCTLSVAWVTKICFDTCGNWSFF